MASKINNLEQLFKDSKSETITYEKVAETFDKPPTITQAKKVIELAKKNKKVLRTSAEAAKLMNLEMLKNKKKQFFSSKMTLQTIL